MPEQLIPHNGNYKKLLSYQKADVIFQLTYYFCERFLTKGDRTIDQMVQAARSGKQNIIEGSAASTTSAKTEIKLINVAKASLQELLEDYEDFLKTRHCRQWEEDSKELNAMRDLGRKHQDAGFFMQLAETRSAEVIANMCIVLIKQADYLLYKQLQRLSDDFLKNGGFTERLYRMRSQTRSQNKEEKGPQRP
jgi:four helix bundle suffix protein